MPNFLHSRAILPLFLGVLILLFQNCSPIGFGQASNTKQSTRLSENGTGYGGKVYVARSLYNQCDDKSGIISRFTTVDAVSATMDRENCMPTSPPSLVSLFEPDYRQLYSTLSEHPFDAYVHDVYIFKTSLPVTPLEPVQLSWACWGKDVDPSTGQARDVKIGISEHTANLDNFIGTIQLKIGALPLQQVLLRNMSKDYVSATAEKVFAGSDGSSTYTLRMKFDVFPYISNITYQNGAQNISAQVTCIGE